MLSLLMLLVSGSGSGPGPSAPPSDATLVFYAGTKIRVRWTNGDATAQTRVFRNGIPINDADPGVTQYDTGYTTGVFRIAHLKNGKLSALVLASP